MRDLIEIDTYIDEVTRLLVEMTNEYIDYRNQIFDSCQVCGDIEDDEDAQYIYEMDQKIDEVQSVLEGLI